MIASQSSGSVSSRPFEWRPATIALFTITSSRPRRWTAVVTSRSMSAQREASAATKTPLPPARSIGSTVGSPPSRVRPHIADHHVGALGGEGQGHRPA